VGFYKEKTVTDKFKFVPDYKTNSENEYFLLKEMEEFKGQTGELIEETRRLTFYRGDQNFKAFPINNIPPRWLIPVKEKTEAEKWIESQRGLMYLHKEVHKEAVKEWSISAHRAGEKYATTATHEIYRPLMEAVTKFVNHMDCTPCDYITENIRIALEKINKTN